MSKVVAQARTFLVAAWQIDEVFPLPACQQTRTSITVAGLLSVNEADMAGVTIAETMKEVTLSLFFLRSKNSRKGNNKRR